jgi:hypothetical protein
MAFLSSLFLIAETVILIDIGYSWGERWKDQYDQGETVYGNLLVAFTLLISAGVVAMLGVQFAYFKGPTNVALIVGFLIAGKLFGSFSCCCHLDYHFGIQSERQFIDCQLCDVDCFCVVVFGTQFQLLS